MHHSKRGTYSDLLVVAALPSIHMVSKGILSYFGRGAWSVDSLWWMDHLKVPSQYKYQHVCVCKITANFSGPSIDENIRMLSCYLLTTQISLSDRMRPNSSPSNSSKKWQQEKDADRHHVETCMDPSPVRLSTLLGCFTTKTRMVESHELVGARQPCRLCHVSTVFFQELI